MVVISLKGSSGDGDGFLFETTTDTPNDELISSLVELQNLRFRSKVIVDSVRGLAQYGPMKKNNPVSSSSDEEIQRQFQNMRVEKDNYKKTEDPTGARTGDPPQDEQTLKTLLQTAQDLEEYIDKGQVQNRVSLQTKIVLDKISNVRGAVVMAYPMGLPEQDLVKISLDNDSLEGTFVANDILDPMTTSLWCAGKEFQRDQKVSHRLGANEKTKIIAKFQQNGSGPPGREPVVNEEERKAMMAHYFKRQEEVKRLAEADTDDYLDSQWADSKEMKRNLQGLDGGIKAPGLRFS